MKPDPKPCANLCVEAGKRCGLVLCILLMVAVFTHGQEPVRIQGYVKKAADSSAMQGVNLIRYSDAQGTATDQEGYFNLKLTDKTDSFMLSAVGYGRTVFDPPDSFKGKAFQTVIYLSETTYGIQEVVIRGEQERAIDVDLSVPADQAQRMANERRAGEGFGYNIPGVASSIYQAFSNDARQRQKVRELRQDKRNVEFLLSGAYRAYIRSEFGLQGKEIRSFLQFCDFRKNYRNANYYEITEKLDRCYTLYYNKVLRERQFAD